MRATSRCVSWWRWTSFSIRTDSESLLANAFRIAARSNFKRDSSRRPTPAGVSVKKIVRRTIRRRDFNAECLSAFQVDQAVRGHSQEPGFKSATPLILAEERLTIRRRGETIRPDISDQILRFGGTRTSRTKDSHQFAMVPAAQFRRGRAVGAHDALRKAQILFVTGRDRMCHSETEDEVLTLDVNILECARSSAVQ